MMSVAGRNVLGLVELSEDRLASGLGLNTSFEVLVDAFHGRLNDWVRPKDQWRSHNHNSVCVVLKDIGTQGELELAAAKLGRVFNEPHYHMGQAMPLLVNAGFAEIDTSSQDMTEAIRQASVALEQAKSSSRLFELYSPSKANDCDNERLLLKKIETAVERGEFQLYYQPQVHAGYKSLIGAEALLRWHTPDRKIIMPDSFIDVAEKNDVIKPLTWWAIKSAVSRLARWPEQLSTAVNISAVLLWQNDIMSVVKDALELFDVAPHRLHLEVTEKIMMENQDVVLAQLARLRKLGVKIAIDDFGTGFSSLAYFRDLPADVIKIDQSFVLHMLESEKDYAIVKAVIDLAHNFDLKVVAEGVETIAISDQLSEMQCDILQGYVFDSPLPVEQFEKHYKVC